MIFQPEQLLVPDFLVFVVTVFDDDSVANLAVFVLLDGQVRAAKGTRAQWSRSNPPFTLRFRAIVHIDLIVSCNILIGLHEVIPDCSSPFSSQFDCF